MGYAVEVSYHLEKCDNVTDTYQRIIDRAAVCHADSCYEHHEMSGNTKYPRCHCVIVSTFSEENIQHCSYFIKSMKQTKHIHVECIYDDSNRFHFLYASPYYIQTMEKHCAKDYKQRRSERSLSLSEGEDLLVDAMAGGKPKTRKPRSRTMDDDPVVISPLFAGPTGPTGPTGSFRPTSA